VDEGVDPNACDNAGCGNEATSRYVVFKRGYVHGPAVTICDSCADEYRSSGLQDNDYWSELIYPLSEWPLTAEEVAARTRG
jgi:hypothetical protein